MTEIERCAELLSARLEEVGAIGAASPAQRLARTAARLAAAADPDGVVREALAAALELSGCESGFVALADGHGALYPHLAEGPFGVAFSQLASEELASMASWVDDGTSTYTVGDTAGRGFVGHEVLRRTGVGSLIVLPLAVAGERLGLLVVADRANRRPAPEDIELLELLALQVATGLRMASALTELRDRVARDALPGQASLLALPDPARPSSLRARATITDAFGRRLAAPGATRDARRAGARLRSRAPPGIHDTDPKPAANSCANPQPTTSR